jgi:hypothetical protein
MDGVRDGVIDGVRDGVIDGIEDDEGVDEGMMEDEELTDGTVTGGGGVVREARVAETEMSSNTNPDMLLVA